MHIHIPLAARRGRRLENALSLQCDQGAGARIEIVKRRIAFDDDPERFVDGFVPLMSELARRIALARRRITEVFVSDDQRIEVAANGTELKLEGLRAELAVIRTARCAAALDGRSAINEIFRKRGASVSGIGEQINPARRSRHRPRRQRARLRLGTGRQKRPARRWNLGQNRKSWCRFNPGPTFNS
jgi:Mg-chelatase subunit ChlI